MSSRRRCWPPASPLQLGDLAQAVRGARAADATRSCAALSSSLAAEYATRRARAEGDRQRLARPGARRVRRRGLAAVAGAAGALLARAAGDAGADRLSPAHHARRDRSWCAASPSTPTSSRRCWSATGCGSSGTRDVPGRPGVLGTTREFLDYFGLQKLEQLPPLAELKALTDLNLQLELPTGGRRAPSACRHGADRLMRRRCRRRAPMRMSGRPRRAARCEPDGATRRPGETEAHGAGRAPGGRRRLTASRDAAPRRGQRLQKALAHLGLASRREVGGLDPRRPADRQRPPGHARDAGGRRATRCGSTAAWCGSAVGQRDQDLRRCIARPACEMRELPQHAAAQWRVGRVHRASVPCRPSTAAWNWSAPMARPPSACSAVCAAWWRISACGCTANCPRRAWRGVLQGTLDNGTTVTVQRCEAAGGEGSNRWYNLAARRRQRQGHPAAVRTTGRAWSAACCARAWAP